MENKPYQSKNNIESFIPMEKETIKSFISMVLRLGGGLSLLLIGAIYMIVASHLTHKFGGYPEFLMIGIAIMSCGLLSFISEVIKQIFTRFFYSKERIKLEKERTKRLAIEKGIYIPYCKKCNNAEKRVTNGD